MSAVIEVSEGLPREGRIFEPPVTDTNRSQPCFLTFVGSLITHRIANDRPWTKGGGIEVANPCLRYVKNFLRKGRITPLLKDTHDFIPYDVAKKIVDGDPLQNGYFAQTMPPGYVPPTLPPPRGNGFGSNPSPTGNLVGRIAYPGDQLNWILSGPANIFESLPRGIVHLRSLQGHDYKPRELEGGIYVDPVIWEIQRAIFPTYPILPTLLDDLDRLLDEAEQHTVIRSTVDEYRESLRQFRDYASTTIQNSHAKMREIASTTRGYIPKYTSTDLVLLEQLGLARQDREVAKAVQAPAQIVASDPELRELFKAFLQSQIEEKEALKTQAAIEEFPCECGKSFDTQSGLNMHRNRWCELRKQGEESGVDLRDDELGENSAG